MMGIVTASTTGAVGAGQEVSRNGPPPASQDRFRVDGKFFARGGCRGRVRGVTYGPFAATGGGDPFPPPPRTAEDLHLMRAAGVNAIRIYDPPPGWLLLQGDEQGTAVLMDV